MLFAAFQHRCLHAFDAYTCSKLHRYKACLWGSLLFDHAMTPKPPKAMPYAIMPSRHVSSALLFAAFPWKWCNLVPSSGGRMQVVLADGEMMPPLAWKDSRRTVAYTTERLHCYAVLRMKAAAVMHTLSSKCGVDAFLSILRGLVQSALSSRQIFEPGAEGADSAPPPWVLSTSTLIKQIAQVRRRPVILSSYGVCGSRLSWSCQGVFKKTCVSVKHAAGQKLIA